MFGILACIGFDLQFLSSPVTRGMSVGVSVLSQYIKLLLLPLPGGIVVSHVR